MLHNYWLKMTTWRLATSPTKVEVLQLLTPWPRRATTDVRPPAWGSKRPRPSEGRFALWAAEATVSYHHAKTKESVQSDIIYIYIYTKIPPGKKKNRYIPHLIWFGERQWTKNIAFVGRRIRGGVFIRSHVLYQEPCVNPRFCETRRLPAGR